MTSSSFSFREERNLTRTRVEKKSVLDKFVRIGSIGFEIGPSKKKSSFHVFRSCIEHSHITQVQYNA